MTVSVASVPIRSAHPDLAPADLERLRVLLGEHRQARLEQIAGLSATDQTDSEFDPGVRVRALAAARDALTDIDSAAARLDDAGYGWCAGCSTPIPVERLLAVPHARLCVGCASRA